MGNPYIYYLAVRAFNTYLQSYFLQIYMSDSFETLSSQKNQPKASTNQRLLDEVQPCFAEFGTKLLYYNNPLIEEQWRKTRLQIISNINKFFEGYPNNKHIIQRGVANSQKVKNDSPIKVQSQLSLDEKFADITKEIMTTKVILDLKSKHEKSLRQLQQLRSQAQLSLQQCTICNKKLIEQIEDKKKQLQNKCSQFEKISTKLREFDQLNEKRKVQFQLQKNELREKYKNYHVNLQRIVSDRIKNDYETQISRLTLEKQALNTAILENIKVFEQKISQLESEIKELSLLKNYTQAQRVKATLELYKISQQYQNFKERFQTNLKQKCEKNKDEWKLKINQWKQQQKRIIANQMNDWLAQIKTETKCPLERRIQQLEQQIRKSTITEEQMKNAIRQLQNKVKPSSKKDQQILSLQQNQKSLELQKKNKEEMIKKIAELILQERQTNEDIIYKKIEGKLQSNLKARQNLEQAYKMEKKKYDDLFTELNDLKADIRNINSTLLDSDDRINKQKLDINLKFACKNINHINLLSKYYQRILKNINKINKVTQELLDKESKFRKLQNEKSDISDKYSRVQKQLNDLRSTIYDIQKSNRQSRQKQADGLKQLKDQKETFEAQKNQLASQLSVKELLVQRINKELSQAKRKITQQDNIIRDMQKSQRGIKTQIQRLNSTNSSAQATIGNLKAQIKKLESRLIQVEKMQKSHIISLQQAVVSATENSQAKSITNFDSLLEFLHSNKPTFKSGPFAFSYILQNLYKQQQKLQQQIKKFLQVPRFTITSSYRYDEFNKNFSNYLPLKSSFQFIIIVRSKKGQIFGAISTGIGKSQRACIFNLNSGKTFESNQDMSSTVYDSGFLMFGQGEMRLKNNANLQVWVNSKIFNARCFTFKRDEIVGPNQDGDSIELTGLEIHRIQK